MKRGSEHDTQKKREERDVQETVEISERWTTRKTDLRHGLVRRSLQNKGER